MKRDEFMKDIQECEILGNFDQKLLDQAAAMFEKWGFWHMIQDYGPKLIKSICLKISA